MTSVSLRGVVDDDLPILFDFQMDEEANRMAAFTAKEPADRPAFMEKWSRIRRDGSTVIRTIVHDGRVAGSVLLWRDPHLDGPEVSYWIGREHWGKGIATSALRKFLSELDQRPIFGRAAADNIGSIHVLEKCGFVRVGREIAFAQVRGEEIEELILRLDR